MRKKENERKNVTGGEGEDDNVEHKENVSQESAASVPPPPPGPGRVWLVNMSKDPDRCPDPNLAVSELAIIAEEQKAVAVVLFIQNQSDLNFTTADPRSPVNRPVALVSRLVGGYLGKVSNDSECLSPAPAPCVEVHMPSVRGGIDDVHIFW